MIFAAVALLPSALLAAGVAMLAAWDYVADRCARKDRHRHIAECSAYGGKLAVVAPPPSLQSIQACEEAWAADSDAAELERMRSGAAFAEAMLLQLLEIRGLDEAPVARSRWS